MMNRKTTILVVILISAIMLSPLLVAASDEEIKYYDAEQDVLNDDNEVANKPNIDISELSAIKTGRQVELKLKLVDGGKIQKSTLIDLYYYGIVLVTSKNEYTVLYLNFDLPSLTPEELEEIEGFEDPCSIIDADMEDIDVISCTGEGTNDLSIKFNVHDSNEILIALSAGVAEQTEEQGFNDLYELISLYPTIQSSYNTKVNTPVNFEATLEDGTASDYEWLWVLDNSSLTFNEQNPTTTFKTPGKYTGTLYVYNETGSLGREDFRVNVTGTAANSGGSETDDTPGFELILVLAAVAIALMIFRKKKK